MWSFGRGECAAKRIWHKILLNPFVVLCLLIVSSTASAQCVVNPTGETAVGLKNASSHFLTLYIDGVNRGGVPSGDRSIDFIVRPGEHLLLAQATIGGEVVSASRTANIPLGYVCTWTVTDPPKKSVLTPVEFQNSLRPELKRAVITLTNAN